MTQAAKPLPRKRSRLAAAAAAAAMMLTPTLWFHANAEPATPICGHASARLAVQTTFPGVGWLENLAFDRTGNLWVTHSYRNVVERYDPSGKLTATLNFTFPAAIRLGPDGLMYVNHAQAPSGGLDIGAVSRFDPTAAQPTPTVFARGLGLPNGAIFDKAGNLYVADTARGVTRIRPDGTIDEAWTSQAPKDIGSNGIAVQGNDLYLTLLTSPTARVLRIPIANPSQATVSADLVSTPPFPPLFPDDLAAGPDGYLYVATGSGQLVRLDPVTHATCTVLSDQPMTSIAFAPGSNHELYAGTESGQLLRITLPT